MAIHRQDKFHRPCGHWHIRTFTQPTSGWACNCWMPSVALDGTELFFVAAGKHMQLYAETGCEIYFLRHTLGSDEWELMYTQLDINAANSPGGVFSDTDIYVFANYKADAHGKRLDPEWYDNFANGVWVYRPSTGVMNYYEFPLPAMNFQDKVGCYTGGYAAIARVNSGRDIEVYVTSNYGASWTLRKTVLSANWGYNFIVGQGLSILHTIQLLEAIQ